MEGMKWEHFSLSLVEGRKKSGKFGGVEWGGMGYRGLRKGGRLL